MDLVNRTDVEIIGHDSLLSHWAGKDIRASLEFV